ncbi:NAD(+) synthase [Roseivirga misakiensis]|uniref:Glutamine-dependent NAD(+) synthetase n=1 Tax=Roseivirga misakiensis TaxID=1563681 RepID=A0A1E5SLG0_9BACT|nr:NAD(+) synthase [Roseivirga misakiensis]OEJ99959.1 NAD(+) synthase [Roseivirga misakiensis]
MRKYRVAGATVNQTPLDWKGNVSRLKAILEGARKTRVELLCLPELSITGYGCEDLFLSHWLPEKALSYLPELIEETEGIFTSFNLPLRHENRLYNTAVVVHNKEIKGVYAKQYMALDGVHYEPRWFNPWPVGVTSSIELMGVNYPIGDLTFDFEDWKIGFEICEDAWRGADRPACRLIDRGVNLILNPSASHFAMQKTKERIALVESSSKNFNCTYVYANLLGNEAGRMIYDGEIIIAQQGSTYLRNELLSFQPYRLRHVDIAPDETSIPNKEFVAPILPKNLEFPKACALALYDYMRKSRSQGFTLSLSGGADSATCAVMVAEMVRLGIHQLGKESFLKNIHKSDLEAKTEKEVVNSLFNTAYQGTKNSSQTTLNAAKTLADSIGAKFYNWEIDQPVASYTETIERVLDRELTWDKDDLALQNIQARSRSPIIWMLTNITNTLLITTSNRSEGDVGYATMDGDTSGSIAPISSVDKDFIRKWLKFAEDEMGYSGLAAINELPPTAELRPISDKQTDEDDLMPYHIMVEIEKLAILDRQSPVEVYQELKLANLESSDLLKTHIRKFYLLWSRNQWKRERLAPAFHLDEFNVDPRTWCRFPILSASFYEELAELEALAD